MQSGVSDILAYFVRDYGVHPRHSPRTFPLGLLAPRCLGLAHFLALPLCGAGTRAPCCLGEGRNPSPSVGLLLAVVNESIQCFILLSGLRMLLPSLFEIGRASC